MKTQSDIKNRKREISLQISALIKERNALTIKEKAKKQKNIDIYMLLVSREMSLIRFSPGNIPTAAALHAGINKIACTIGSKGEPSYIESIAGENENLAFTNEINPHTGELYFSKFWLWDWKDGPVLMRKKLAN